MTLQRRELLAQAGAAVIAPLVHPWTSATTTKPGATMYGLIGKMTAVAGQRDVLAAILLEGTDAMPGCLSYVIASDPAEPEALWITEVWDSPASHQASLALPAVKAAITKGRALIAGFSHRVETVPIGGYGLQRAAVR
jgi:quinol monooxygenase YgiN